MFYFFVYRKRFLQSGFSEKRETRLKGRVASLDGHCIFLAFSELGDRRLLQRETNSVKNKKMSKLEEIIKVLGSFTALKHARRM